MRPIYLDYNATTPVDPQALEAMLPFLRSEYGNPSSAYALGRRAHAAVEQARAEVAALIGAEPDEIIFTGGATEASNIAIRGAVAINAARDRVVTTNIEHPATEACCNLLERAGNEVRRIGAQRNGIVRADDVAAAIDGRTALVTIIHAQNEIGTLQPVPAIARAARERGALVHADAAQSVGKIPVGVKALGVDMLTIAGHKLYAPKGVGALYVRRGLQLPPLVVGAGQERGIRPGTENVAFAVALGTACRIAAGALAEFGERVGKLASELLVRLQAAVPGLVLAGDADERLPNTLNVLFPGVSGREVLEASPVVLASTGSACHADSEEPSAILTALGLSPKMALGAVRLSLGRSTTARDIATAAASLATAWRDLRAEKTSATE